MYTQEKNCSNQTNNDIKMEMDERNINIAIELTEELIKTFDGHIWLDEIHYATFVENKLDEYDLPLKDKKIIFNTVCSTYNQKLIEGFRKMTLDIIVEE